MKETADSLSGFIAKVLSAITAATYVPAAVIVGAGWMIGSLSRSEERDPVTVLLDANTPGFGELASFTIAVVLVAAVLGPCSSG